MSYRLKGCPKCGGDQLLTDEGDLDCQQCGHIGYAENTSRYRSPVPEAFSEAPFSTSRPSSSRKTAKSASRVFAPNSEKFR